MNEMIPWITLVALFIIVLRMVMSVIIDKPSSKTMAVIKPMIVAIAIVMLYGAVRTIRAEENCGIGFVIPFVAIGLALLILTDSRKKFLEDLKETARIIKEKI